MADIAYTPAQRRAVFYPDGNLLLSAAAGSGKTAALTGRIVELITAGRAELSEMLIVTFSKAAAGEMKTRIAKKLREKMEKSRDSHEIVSRVSRALGQLPSADISTIHSFLYQSLRTYFPVLHLSQDSVIGEEKEFDRMKTELMRDVVDDFFSYRTEEEKRDFVLLADTIGQVRDTTAIDEELLWLAGRMENMGKSLSSLKNYADGLEAYALGEKDAAQSPFGKVILEEVRSFAAHYGRIFASFADEFTSEPVVLEKYGPAMEGDTAWIKTLLSLIDSEAGYDSVAAHVTSYEAVKLGTVSAKHASEGSKAYKEFRDAFKKEAGELGKRFFPLGAGGSDAEAFRNAAEKTAKILRTAHTVLAEYEKRFTQKKQALSLMEYGDLERYATAIFLDENGEATAAAKEIGAKYRYIFVDEYQDTNRVQDNIFRAVGGDAVRFMVGDIKQSIYRFRGADPRVFAEYRKIWEKADIDGDDCPEGGASIFMSENFRCSPDIIRFINAVSDAILPYGGIPYEREDALVCGTASEERSTVPAEVVLIDKKAPAANGEMPETLPDEAEAEYVAGRIAAMIGRYSEDGKKILEPKDFAVLLRSPGSDGEAFVKALEQRGIPAVTKTAKPLGEYASVLLLTCLLRMIDNPLRDIHAAGAMRSPIFGFTAEDLVILRRCAGAYPLYTAVTDLAHAFEGDADEGENGIVTEELRKKCRKICEFLEEEKTMLGGMTADKYIENLLAKTDFLTLDGIRRNGSERDAVQRMTEIARGFSKSKAGSPTLGAFLDYFDDFLAKKGDKNDSGSSEGVSVCSIHASKGLEYPVCFLSKTAKRRNDQDERRAVLFDDVLGFGMQLPDSTGLVRCDNMIRRAIGVKMANDSIEEEMRMLYVALTRAQGKLIVTSTVDNAEKWLDRKALEAEFSDAYSVRDASSYIDWIAAGISGKRSQSWTLSVVSAADVIRQERTAETAEESADRTGIDETTLELLRRRENIAYPYEFLAKIPAKLIVSRLEPEILDDESYAEKQTILAGNALIPDDAQTPAERETPVLRRPLFMQEETAAKANEIGTATHRFLQFADFHALSKNGFEAERKRLTEKQFLSQNDADLIRADQIERFRKSKLFAGMLESPFVRREFRFNVLVDAADFTSDDALKAKLTEYGTKITVQGVVDCVYRDPDSGKLVLVDYKTDAVFGDEWKNRDKARKRLREKHKNQLTYYREICRDLFEEEIAKACIYSTVLGETIEI